MNQHPDIPEWSFGEIEKTDPDRARVLDAADPPEALVVALSKALEKALDCDEMRIGVDSVGNQFDECRVTIQFKVEVELYDWCFNGRTGYRAQFWISPDAGLAFNAEVTRAFRGVLDGRLPERVEARRIVATFTGGVSREEEDVGSMTAARDFVHHSLEPNASKLWICERLIRRDRGKLSDIGFPTLSAAERGPKLGVPRWASATHVKTGQTGEGVRAPYPSPEDAWLDLKGGFVRRDGTVWQIKSQTERARALHETGWT